MKTALLVLALLSCPIFSGQALAQSEPTLPNTEDRRELIQSISETLSALDTPTAIAEMQLLAAQTLAAGNIEVFRSIMVASVDHRWEGLENPETALNMISWMPDTAEFLLPRINAAEISIAGGILSDIEASRLWQGLRARVERVGSDDLLEALVAAQIRTADSATAITTLERFNAPPRTKIRILANLLVDNHAAIAPATRTDLLETLSSHLKTVDPGPSRALVVKAYWISGARDRARNILDQEQDPIQALRLKLTLLNMAGMPDTTASSPGLSQDPLDPPRESHE